MCLEVEFYANGMKLHEERGNVLNNTEIKKTWLDVLLHNIFGISYFF